MIIKKLLLSDIVSCLGVEIIRTDGVVENVFIDNVTNSQKINESSLDWINKAKDNKQCLAEMSLAKVLLVDETIHYTSIMKEQNKTLLVVKDPKKSLAKILRCFFVDKPKPFIHPTAFIDPAAVIGENVYIGPNCYIGKCVIGNGNIIHSNVCIYDRTVIGNNNEIHSGAIICVDGLGCMRQPDGRLEEFPQIGGVIIGDNTYIGGNTHIASGSLSDTIISDGCKINGMCFIGSNDVLHENVWITGSTMLAGSVEVGKNTTIFSRVVVRDWCKIGERSVVGMGSVVTKDIPDGETWIGTPAHKLEKNEK